MNPGILRRVARWQNARKFGDLEERVQLAGNTQDGVLLRRLGREMEPDLLFRIVGNPSTPSGLLDSLVREMAIEPAGTFSLCLMTASLNPLASDHTLGFLGSWALREMNDGRKDGRESSPSVIPFAYATLSESVKRIKSHELQRQFFDHIVHCSPNLAQTIGESLAANPECSSEIQGVLAKVPNEKIASRLVMNPAVSDRRVAEIHSMLPDSPAVVNGFRNRKRKGISL
jgi:hypothetical protein